MIAALSFGASWHLPSGERGAGFGESLAAQVPALDALLLEARAHWPELAERRAQLAAAEARTAEAAMAFRPNVGVGGTYTLAGGGRAIGLPVGDLLNPVYSTLNQLTQSQSFPQIDNVEENFLPNNFYDARLRVRQPIFDPTLKLQRRLAEAGSAAAVAAIEVSEDELDHRVRQAYFNVLQAREAVAILADADTLVAEALRTTQSLIRNGAGLPLARERILAERAQVEAQMAGARAQAANAVALLEYLTGVTTTRLEASDSLRALPRVRAELVERAGERPELDQLRAAIQAKGVELAIEDKFRAPRLGVQVDGGSQAFDFGLQPYVLAGVTLDIPLYDGGRVKQRQARLRAERDATQARLEGARRGFALAVEVALNDLTAAEATLAAYEPAISAAERTLHDAQILYRNGSSSYLELLDARTQVTRVRLEHNLARYNTWLRYVEYLRAVGG